MEDEKITLDKEAFKALASDTRVAILKSLDKRRKMLTELSKQLGMSPSTVKEHMESLTRAGLVVMIDDGHKWKYYELTRKGENVLHPVGTKIWILLSVSVLAVLVSIGDLLRSSVTKTYAFSSNSLDMIRAPVAGGAEKLAQNVPEAADATMGTASQAPVPYVHVAAIIVFAALAGIAALHIYRKKG